MSKDVIDFKKIDWEIKKKKFKAKAKDNFQKGVKWIEDNKEAILVATPFVIAGGNKLVKFTAKQINLRSEEKVKELFCYDRSLGHYWELRRKLTNKEWLEIDRRKANGERLADILAEMRVLK